MGLTEIQRNAEIPHLQKSAYSRQNFFAEGISQIFAKYEGMQNTLAFVQKPLNTENWLNFHYELSLFYLTQHDQHF